MRRKASKILGTVLLSLLVLILVVELFYLPRYWGLHTEITPVESTGEELTIMSANVRCYSPLDFLIAASGARRNCL